jgi:Ca-activated chloride channel family protein
MSRAAGIGRGTFTYIGKQTEVKEKMLRLFDKLAHPVIADLNLNLTGDAQELEVYPSPLPDLYMGEPLILAIRTGWENATLRISGSQLGKPWETLVDTSSYGQRDGIAALWARKKIRMQMEALALGADKERVREVVLKTALKHHLVSKYTSLVAVDNRISRPGSNGLVQRAVKTHLPQGWKADAIFGGAPQTATPAGQRLLIGCLLLLTAALVALIRRGSRCVLAGK